MFVGWSLALGLEKCLSLDDVESTQPGNREPTFAFHANACKCDFPTADPNLILFSAV